MNKTYKTFAELYAARPNDLPFMIQWAQSNEFEIIYPFDGSRFYTQWAYSENVKGLFHDPSDLCDLSCTLVDWFDEASVESSACNCDFSRGNWQCLCGAIERERNQKAA